MIDQILLGRGARIEALGLHSPEYPPKILGREKKQRFL